MRAFLLLFLGAGLVWFVWRGLASDRSEEVAAGTTAPGAMISVAESRPDDAAEGAPVERRPEEEPRPEPAVVPQPAARTPEARPAGPIPAQPVAPSPERAPPSSSHSLPGEIAAANELLRDPARLESWLAVHGAELGADRREYGLGLAQALSNQVAASQASLERAGQDGGVQPSEGELLRRLAGEGGGEISVHAESPLARAASMKAVERAGLAHLSEGRASEAAQAFSRLLLAEIASPWAADPARLAAWSANLHEAQRRNRWNPRGNWPSREMVVQPGDSLIGIRKRAIANDPNLVICTGLIARANGLEGDVIHPGEKLKIPVDAASALVDLDAHWAFFLLGDEVAEAWPVGVGKESSATQVGTFHVGKKETEPMWFPQGRPAVPYGDPQNPLGTRWISWNDAEGRSTGLGFHGTNEPSSVGKDASLGCIRMRTPDVEALFDLLPVGARVEVRP